MPYCTHCGANTRTLYNGRCRECSMDANRPGSFDRMILNKRHPDPKIPTTSKKRRDKDPQENTPTKQSPKE